jgi:uncharacterized membrane protein YuzA (DUF378 family)
MRVQPSFIKILTFVFGIFPATLLIFYAIVLGLAGVGAIVTSFGRPERALGAIVAIPLSVMAVYGYIALFYAAGDKVNSRVAKWLLVGMIANVIGFGSVAISFGAFVSSAWYALVFFCPLLVGCAHLARFRRIERRRASV